MFKIYLAGAMSGLSKQERISWRKQAQLYLAECKKVEVINPCDFYDFDIITKDTTEKEIKYFDLWQVRTSDLILVNLNNPNSIGTAMELQAAEDVKIPIIGFHLPSIEIHPWLELALTKRYDNVLDALEHIIKYYLHKGD